MENGQQFSNINKRTNIFDGEKRIMYFVEKGREKK